MREHPKFRVRLLYNFPKKGWGRGSWGSTQNFCRKFSKNEFLGPMAHFRSHINDSIRHQASSHRSNQSEDRAVMEFSRHLYGCGKGFRIWPIFKLKENSKILRLVMEDKLIKLLKPSLNADQRNLLHLQLKG